MSRLSPHSKSSGVDRQMSVSYFQFGEDSQFSKVTHHSHNLGQDLRKEYQTFLPRVINQLHFKECTYVTGCCLLADISGFTKLSSRLCSSGPTGIDSLRMIIDHSFASFVSVIHQFGGDGESFYLDIHILLSSSSSLTSTFC